MEIITTRVQNWRKYKSNSNVLFKDITRKCGDPIFAPSRELLNGYKYNGLSQSAYIEQYTTEMRRSFTEHNGEWMALVRSEVPVVLACFCAPGKFCHRLLLKDFLLAIAKQEGIPSTYSGEQ